MQLQEIVKDITNEVESMDQGKDIGNILITGITDNSKEVKKGHLFVAVSGYNFEGHAYIEEAIKLGAAAIIGEKEVDSPGVPYIKVYNSRKVLGLIAKNFYGDPSSEKIMIGITGTNGKTTISHMLRHILENNGVSCSVIGTLHYIINGKKIKSGNTTPGPLKLNSLLAASNDRVVIMEVSSHGLVQHRIEGIKFDYCIFTNLYHEHLDFHGTMEEYFQAKALLFNKLKPNGVAIINGDNDWGEKLYENLKENKINTYLVGQTRNSDLLIEDYNTSKNPFISLKENTESIKIHLPLPGIHNLYNAALSYPVARGLAVSKNDIFLSFNQFPGVPGRFEVYTKEEGPTFVIDYAHTSDAIFHILKTARECGAKKIYHIFGFRGGRDKSKRSEMVKVSSELSDVTILTTDDLNTEGNEMYLSMNKLHMEYYSDEDMIIHDRTLAIQYAFAKGSKKDWVIITGKGPESYKHKFALPTTSDKETVLYLQGKKQKRKEAFLNKNIPT